jgi:DeoR family transcriptional regulator, fructose operon transcriptional repressor
MMRRATKDRQQRVMSELLDRKHVTVKQLADNMGVSEATARRDLRTLANSQQLSLVHGGATLAWQDFSFLAKHDRNLTAKRIIGCLAAELVTDGQQLFLDSGTTTFEMAPFLARKRGLSIVLNSARLALELRAPDTHIIMLGGQFRPDRMDTVGPITLANLEQLRGFTAFVGADGLAMEFGPSAVDMESAHLYRQAVTNARETVLLVDHTKFEAASLFRIVEWAKISHIVTDLPPSREWHDFLAAQNIHMHYPETPPDTADSSNALSCLSHVTT